MIWVSVVICLLVSCTFSGIEAGMLSVNRVRLRHRVKLKEASAIALQRLLSRPERLLVTVLIVTNLMNITALLLSTGALVSMVGGMGYLVSGLLWVPLYLAVLELLPKSLFRRFPYRALAALTPLLRITDILLSPFLNAGEWIMRIAFPRGHDSEKKLFIAREDFKYMTIESERQGTITQAEREMIHNVVDFRTVTARDVMTPLENVKTVPPDMAVLEFLDMARKSHLDRLPVAGTDGRMAGLVNVSEVLLDAPRSGTIAAMIRRIVSVHSTELAYSVMKKMRAARLRLAVVEDEKGRAVGTVSSDELIQKLVKPKMAA
jgi:putative hemolysin